MGRSNPIRRSCACGREIRSRTAEMCADCSLAGPARVFMGNAIRQTGRVEDLAAANVCPKRAEFIDAIIARRKAGAE